MRTRLSWVWVSAVAWILYLLTLSRHYTGGSLEFASEIESSNWAVLLQPHKMLVHPMGWVFYQAWRLSGWRGNSLLPSQVLNALAGAICVGLLYQIIQRLAHSQKIALVVACGFAFSCASWLFSTEAEFVTIPLAEALGILAWLLTITTESQLRFANVLLLGVATSISALTYIANLSLAPVVLIVFWLADDLTRRERLRRIARYLTVTVVIFLGIFIPAMTWVHSHRVVESPTKFQIYGGQGTGTLYGRLDWKNIPWSGYAILRSLAGYPSLGPDDRTTEFLSETTQAGRAVFALFYLFTLGIMLAPGMFIGRKRRPNWQRFHRPVSVLAVWAGLNAAFAFYWVPRDTQFWMPVLAAWWLLVGFILIEAKDADPIPEWKRRINLWPVIATLVGILLLVNGLGLILPHHSLTTNRSYQFANRVHQQTQPQDLVLMVIDDHYVPYFSGRQALSIPERILTLGSTAAALADIDQRNRQVWDLGGSVYLILPLPDQTAVWNDLQAIGLTPEALQRFHTTPAWTMQSQAVLEITP